MIYKSYNFKLLSRFFLILANFLFVSYSVFELNYILIPIFLFLISIIQIIELANFIHTSNKSLVKFLNDINYQDLSAGYGLKKYGGNFKLLEETYKQVLQKMKEISHEKEASLEILNTIVEQIEVGLMVIKNGEVTIMNQIAQTLLNAPNYKTWNRFEERIPEFTTFIVQNNFNESKIYNVNGDGNKRSISINRTVIQQKNTLIEIITLVNIENHLSKNEVESYNKLISVLTHEIMNTISPIVSLSKTLEDKLSTSEEDLSSSAKIISERSEGLLNFVKNYRKISKIPEPHFDFIVAHDLLNDVKKLMEQNLSQGDEIIVNCIPKQFEINLDRNLIFQSLINLVKNSIEAKKEGRNLSIQLNASQKNGIPFIEVSDNGVGISKEIVNDVLVPFFTSKDEGTGIGLSIVNQIMIKHEGRLNFNSEDEKTTFSLIFSNS